MISSAVLQIIAIITMTIDHLGLYLFDNNPFMRIIGRLAFPLFAFMVAEGFRHTHSWQRYSLRILIASIVTQIIFYFAHIALGIEYSHNVLFTLNFALIALALVKYSGFFFIAIPILGLIASVLNCEYGVFGVFLVVGFYYANMLFMDNVVARVGAQFLLLCAMMLSLAQYNNWPTQAFAIFAIVPIALYSGKKGHRLPKLFGYGYYPLHLLIIFILALVFR